MKAFRVFLIFIFLTILFYTLGVIRNHGLDFFRIAFNDIMAINWPGQFVLDFQCYLIITTLWIVWRHNFSPNGIAIALLCLVGGILVFAPYIFIISLKTNGDIIEMLTGEQDRTGER